MPKKTEGAAEEPPVQETPAEETPAEEPPAEEPPVEQPPVEQPPAEAPPAPPAEVAEDDDDGGVAAAAAALEADVERAFAFDTMTGPARTIAKRFHSLARHVVEVLPEGNARAVALAKLRKARGAVLRPMLAN